MSDIVINPLDYATEFTFPTSDGGDVEVAATVVPGKWIITRGLLALTVDNDWVPFRGLSPDSPSDMDLVGFDRDRALAIAHQWAQKF